MNTDDLPILTPSRPGGEECRNCGAAHHVQQCPELRAALHTDDATLIELMALRRKVAECRAQGLWLTVNTLRHQAMCLAERFVDEAWFVEADEQRTADRVSLELRQSCIEMSRTRVEINDIPIPF